MQRAPDFTGEKIQTFRAVFLRHGLPCALVGLACLVDERFRSLLAHSLRAALLTPSAYFFAALLIFAVLVLHCVFKHKSLQLKHVGWICYLGLLSVWEEWVFRVAGPFILENIGLTVLSSILLSNIIFGAMHFFTLRWKWHWCVIAGLGGLVFSHHFEMHANLAAIIAIHWVATYLNTPNLPGIRSLQREL